MGKRTQALNLFEITNLRQLNGNYRLFEIKDLETNWRHDDEQLKNLNNLLKIIAYEKHIPVALVSNDLPCIAIPASQNLERLEYSLTPDVMTLVPVAGEKSIDFRKLDSESKSVALSFLRFALQGPLIRDIKLWSSGSSYYTKFPINGKDSGREVDIYGGFGFRLLSIDNNIYVVVKLSYKYGDPKWLVNRCKVEEINEYKMRHALYHYGNRFFPVQLLGVTGKSITDQKFKPENSDTTTVFDYTLKDVGPNPPQWISTLNPSSPAITYRYPTNQKRRYGAAALCKLLLKTDDHKARELHSRSIVPPQKRLERTQNIVRQYLNNAFFNNIPIRISDAPLERTRKVFPVPSQLFGQGKVLQINKEGVLMSELGKTRLEFLRDPDIGAIISSPFNAQYLIAPLSLERDIVEDFKDRLEKTIQQFFHGTYSMELVLFDDRKAKTLKDQAESIMAKCQETNIHGYAVLILPQLSKPDLHNFIKRKLWEKVQCQCVMASNLRNFYHLVMKKDSPSFVIKQGLEGRYYSYLRYTALGHLMVNRKWLWALGNDLHYDVYVGLDVLNNCAAFTFLYDKGKECFSHLYPSKQKEKLLPAQINTIIYDNLRKITRDGKISPRSLIIHRDGRSYASEWKGFRSAVDQLKDEKVLSKDIEIGVVDIHKSHSFGFRLLSNNSGKIENPTIGSWDVFGRNDGIICTTGYPFKFPGTANPLYIQIPYGDLNIELVLEDIFALSQLCWMSPEGCSRLPIDIKLCDEFLKPVAGEADDDRAIYGDFDEMEQSDEQFEERRVML